VRHAQWNAGGGQGRPEAPAVRRDPLGVRRRLPRRRERRAVRA
jgi:hypothetical protein